MAEQLGTKPKRPPTLPFWGLVGAILQENERVGKLTPTQRLAEIRKLIEKGRATDATMAREDSPAYWPHGLGDGDAEQIERLAKGGR